MGTRMHKYIENYINNAEWDNSAVIPFNKHLRWSNSL